LNEKYGAAVGQRGRRTARFREEKEELVGCRVTVAHISASRT